MAHFISAMAIASITPNYYRRDEYAAASDIIARLRQTEMTRQLPPRPLGVTDKGRKLHKQYPAGDTLGYLNSNVSGCGKRLIDRLATEDEKRALVHYRAPGCVGVP